MDDLTDQVIGIVAAVAKREPAEVTPQTRLAEDLMIKSIGRIELAALIDARFSTRTSNFEIRKPATVAELTTLVASKL